MGDQAKPPRRTAHDEWLDAQDVKPKDIPRETLAELRRIRQLLEEKCCK